MSLGSCILAVAKFRWLACCFWLVIYSYSRVIAFKVEPGSRFRTHRSSRILMIWKGIVPAVDKFICFPEADYFCCNSSQRKSPNWISHNSPIPPEVDPFQLVHDDLKLLLNNSQEILVTGNAILSRAVSHLFLTNQGKCLRPAIIALMGRALSGGQISSYLESELRNSHRQLALIAEMIHAASLIHDDVLDNAEVRRGSPSVHTVYSSKVAVLAGDFLLARASVLLAQLHNHQVVELVASCLDSLVQGEILQSSANKDELSDMKFYLRKSYLKTASLICNTCKATALLSGYDESDPITLATEEFGFHLGMAFQIVDDILDFSGTSSSLGKPTQVDMRLGLATAPVLFAAQEFKELLPLIERRFNLKDDVSNAVLLALQTDCVERSFALAEYHANKAMMATSKLPSSEARLALQRIVHFVISRNK